MFVKSLLKSKKGSTLILSILIIIVMSLLGVSLMAVTLSSMKMSIFYNDLDKAYSLAEACAEEIISNVDQKVAEIQESSRSLTSEDLKIQLKENPVSLRDPEGNVTLATSEPNNVSKLEEEYELKYFTYFKDKLNNSFGIEDKVELMKELFGTTDVDADGTTVYKDLGDENGRMFFKSVQYDSTNHTLNIRVSGYYNEYEKNLDVILSLLAEPDNSPYRPIERSRIKNPVKYDILKKAIVTEKNFIATGGSVVITGDVLSFGTVPVVDDTLLPADRVEDYSANWNKYGGIIVGMCRDVADISGELDFDSSKTGTSGSSSLTINGNASTMGYIHTIYSTSIHPSSISIAGDAYARSLRSEKYSSYSTLNLNNLSTIDNLQIDSSGTQVNINGVYKGLVDTRHAIDGSGFAGSQEDISEEDELVPKRTSSVVVNGDSVLNFLDAIYIGGSTFFKNLTDANGFPYMSGISALKSTMRMSNAFTRDEPSNPDNKLFWFQSGEYVEPTEIADYKSYFNGTGNIDMFSGRQSEPGYFPLINRAMHFKKVWTDLWSTDVNGIYPTYINADSINIKGNGITADGKLRGYSNGAIIANGTVYDSYQFEHMHDPSTFHINIQKPAIEAYFNQISGLLSENYNSEFPKLDFTTPTKNISDYIDSDFIGTNRIEANKPYVSSNADLGFVYYGNTDVEIKQSGGNWYINSEVMPITKGIIYVDGNVYVQGGFDFTGTLMSSKNIIFLGDASVTYNQSAIDALLKADVNINGFFGLLTYEMPDETLESQRISTKNTRIVKWNEIK